IDFAAARAAALMVEVSGGELAEGMLDEGGELPRSAEIVLRPARCRGLIGLEIAVEEMVRILGALEVGVRREGEALVCTPPAFRPDLTREVDLIEEVARM